MSIMTSASPAREMHRWALVVRINGKKTIATIEATDSWEAERVTRALNPSWEILDVYQDG